MEQVDHHHHQQQTEEQHDQQPGSPTTCNAVPTMDSDQPRRGDKMADVDGARIYPKCFASNAERWVTSPTCVPIPRCQAIVAASSAVQAVKHANLEIALVHTSSAVVSAHFVVSCQYPS